MEKHIAIIGGGIAGLSAGCYARLHGYRATILEMNSGPGGLCTGWERKGYTFDGCIQYLFGTAPGQPFHRMWTELGALQDRPITNLDGFMRILDPDGRSFTLWADPARLEEEIASLSPADARRGRELADGVRAFRRFDLSAVFRKPRELMTPLDFSDLSFQFARFFPEFARWRWMSAGEYGRSFHDPFLRRAFPIAFGWPEMPMLAALMMLAYMHAGNAGIPRGGSLAFAQAIAERFRNLGGEIEYSAQVERIMVAKGRAIGVRLYDDRELRADHVISAADGRTTLLDMLGEEWTTPEMRRRFSGGIPTMSQLQVSLGVARDLRGQFQWTTHLLPEPVQIAGDPVESLGIRHFAFDPTLAPAGKQSLVVMLRSRHPYWQHLYGRPPYVDEQVQESEKVIDHLDGLYPGLRGQIEATDTATPLSYERYTGNWMGSICGFLLTGDTMQWMLRGVKKTVPGLSNFWMCGHWVEPGGNLPIAAASGRNAITLIRAHDGARGD